MTTLLSRISLARRFTFLLLIAATLIIIAYIASESERDSSARTIFVNGDIVTMNPQRPTAEAVLVKGDRILAVGTEADLSKLVDADTQRIDLQGRTLMPGFIEPHTHPVASAILADWVDVSGFNNPTPESVVQTLKRAVTEAEPGEWIMAFGLDPVLTQGLTPPDRYALDKIAPDNPLFILSQIMHTAYVNSRALAVSGLNANSVDPEGGHFERDANGELTGILHEEALKALSIDNGGVIGKIQQALAARQALITQYNRYAKAGYTTVGIPGPVPLFPGYLQLLEHVASRNDSPIRSYVYPMAGELEKTDYTPGYRNGNYEVLGVKIHLDGSPWTGSMATAEPYLENQFTRGIIQMPDKNLGLLKHSPDALQKMVDTYHNAGWQIAVHAHGERAHDLILNAFESVQSDTPVEGRRHRLEHLGLITLDNLQRAARLGMTPSFFIDHIYYFGPVIKDQLLGSERAERFMPLEWATQIHDRVSVHTDNPATPLNPMRALRTAVTRIPRHAEVPLNSSQKMSVGDALQAITIDAAWQLHAEDELGSIETGKRADFTLLSENPLKIAPEQWQSITVVHTWLAGQRIVLE